MGRSLEQSHIEPGLLKKDESFHLFLVNRKRNAKSEKKGPITQDPLSNRELREIKESQRTSRFPWITVNPNPPQPHHGFQTAIKRLKEENPSQPLGIVWPNLAIQIAQNKEGNIVLLRHPQDPKIEYPRNFPLENFPSYNPQYLRRYIWWNNVP